MRYILTLLGLTAVALGAISAAMWRLDPYGYFGRFPLGLYTDGTFRHVKALLVNRSGADLAILGASTAVPINPADITGCRAFNAAFNGARPTELLYMVREVLPEGTKSVLMGLDFFAFNRATDNGYDNPHFGRMTLTKTLSYTLSYGAIREAKFVSKMARFKRQQVLDRTNGNKLDAASTAADDAALPAIDHAVELEWVRTQMFQNWSYGAERKSVLVALRDTMAARGIRAAVYITPMSDSLLGMLDEIGARADLERFRRDVAEVFPEVEDLTGTMSDNRLFLKRDPLHFPPATANMVAERALARAGLCGYRSP